MNKKNITVKEFVEKYNKLTSDELKIQFLKSVVKDKYIPFENKVTICEKIVESSYYVKTKDKNGIEIKKLHINSPAKHMLYHMNIVNNYTVIDVDFKNCLEEFNLLNKNGFIENMFCFMPRREMEEFTSILNMVESDILQNEYETHAFISSQVERFGELTSATLSPLLQILTDNLENLDENKLNNIINIADKFIGK